MSIIFNADEIFEMAEKIEKNGASFYRKAADFQKKNQTASRLLNELASMEEGHRLIYAAMRRELSSKEVETTFFDPDNEVKDYLHAIADKSVFNADVDPSSKLTGNESLAEILRTAIGMEKESIIFYLGLRDIVPERLGRDKIGDIIAEEKRHIVMLTNELSSL